MVNEPNLKIPVCNGCNCQDPTTKWRPYWGDRYCWGCASYLHSLEGYGDFALAQVHADNADLQLLKGTA